MPRPYIPVLVLIIAAHGEWKWNSYQAEHDHGDLYVDTKVGLEYLDNVTRALGVIRTIHRIMAILQGSMEESSRKRLDSSYGDDTHRYTQALEDHVFRHVFIADIQEIEDALAIGLTTEVWELTEIAMDKFLRHSPKLLNYRKYMNTTTSFGFAKMKGKFENVDFEVTETLALLAGAEQCAYSEWKKIYETMAKFVQWTRNGLKWEEEGLADIKVKTLNQIWEYAYTANILGDSYASYIGVTSLSSNYSTWFEQKRGEEIVAVQVGGASDQEEGIKLQEVDNLFLAIEFTVRFDMKTRSHRVGCYHTHPFSSWPFGAPNIVS